MILRPVSPQSATRSAHFEAASRVDVGLGVRGQPVAGQHGFDDLFGDGFVEGRVVDLGRMLGGQDDGVDGDGRAVGTVAEGKLALGVWAEKVEA